MLQIAKRNPTTRLGNLTDLGERRMFRMGVALRRMYGDFLDYEPNSVLALTSNSFRCKQTQQATLRGLFSIHSTLENGLELSRRLTKKQLGGLPAGSGSSSAWQQVAQDTQFLPSLDEAFYENSKYAKRHPSPLNKDLKADFQIKRLPGINKLCSIVRDRYKLQCDATIDLWTQIECELYLDRTGETIEHMSHFADWIHEPIAQDTALNQSVTLYELFEEVMLLAYLNRIDASGHYLISAPIINSLIESQSVAMGLNGTSSSRAQRYSGKKLILGSSHDIILTALLHDMGVIKPPEGAAWAKRLMEAKAKGASDVDKYRAGLMMAHFGLSLKFELVRVESSAGKWHVVRLAIYSEPDPNAAAIEWSPAPLGSVCKSRYLELNPGKNPLLFYPANKSLVKLNEDFDCPFELFKEVMKPWLLDEKKYDKLYNDSK